MTISDLKWWHSIRLTPELKTSGLSGHDSDNIEQIEKRFGVTESLVKGKTVLDIGCWDGLFCFEAEKRGASEITGIDIAQNLGEYGGAKCFALAKEILHSKAVFKQEDVYEHKGLYDVVLFFGVLYHLDEPLKALQRIAEMTRETLLLETAITHIQSVKPIMELAFGAHKDHTNKFYPNYQALETMLRYVGFTDVRLIYTFSNRITVRATK